MTLPIRLIFVLLAPLFMTGCFLTPGDFESELTIENSGQFTFAYRGEIVLNLPNRAGSNTYDVEAIYADIEPTCYNEPATVAEPDAVVEPDTAADAADGADDWSIGIPDTAYEPRECTPEEIAEQRAEWQETIDAMRENEQRQATIMMQLLGGINIDDDETMRAYAARLQQQRGWNSVVYRGNRVFEVDYRITGSVDQGFVFPVLDGFEVSQPMVVITAAEDGTVRVQAPGFASDRGLAGMMLLSGMGEMADAESPVQTIANGRFVVRTNGDIRTNNTENGPADEAGMRVLAWMVDGLSRPKPETLIRLSR